MSRNLVRASLRRARPDHGTAASPDPCGDVEVDGDLPDRQVAQFEEDERHTLIARQACQGVPRSCRGTGTTYHGDDRHRRPLRALGEIRTARDLVVLGGHAPNSSPRACVALTVVMLPGCRLLLRASCSDGPEIGAGRSTPTRRYPNSETDLAVISPRGPTAVPQPRVHRGGEGSAQHRVRPGREAPSLDFVGPSMSAAVAAAQTHLPRGKLPRASSSALNACPPGFFARAPIRAMLVTQARDSVLWR